MRVLRSVVLGGALGVAAVFFLARNTPWRTKESPRNPPVSALTADQIRTQQLLRENAALESEAGLAVEYQSINAEYFDGGLPGVRIRWEPRLAEVGPLIAADFRLEGVTDGRVILLLPSLEDDPSQLRRVLCHEMVHVAFRDQPEAHGPALQARLRDLADRGAFAGIVATDDDKQQLKRTLDVRSEALARELADLLRDRSIFEADSAVHNRQIDDLNARTAAANQRQSGWPSESEHAAVNVERERLQDRAWEFNSRMRQYNEAVAGLNSLAEQYNLMISYPDGLDGQRVARRPTLPQTKPER